MERGFQQIAGGEIPSVCLRSRAGVGVVKCQNGNGWRVGPTAPPSDQTLWIFEERGIKVRRHPAHGVIVTANRLCKRS
jgi:hypothetical protein